MSCSGKSMSPFPFFKVFRSLLVTLKRHFLSLIIFANFLISHYSIFSSQGVFICFIGKLVRYAKLSEFLSDSSDIVLIIPIIGINAHNLRVWIGSI